MLFQWGAQFKDFNGADVTISIEYKTILGEPVTNYIFTPASDSPLEITYFTKDENDIFAPILYSKCELKVLLRDDEASKQLLNTMNTVLDGDYVLMVQIANGAEVTKWYGMITIDQIDKGLSYQNDSISITAICPLTFSKNQRLAKISGEKFLGRSTIYDYVEAIITNSLADYGTVPTIDFSINLKHDLILCNHTLYSPGLPYPDHTYFPDFFHQIKLNASLFYEQDGRSMVAHDVLERICSTFGIRLQFKNGVFDFQEILQVHETGYYEIGTKEHYSEIDVNDILIQNAEKISKIRQFKEAYIDHQYAYAYGLLKNSFLTDWTTVIAPDDITFSFYLPDYSVRKRGNGREENPYGVMLRSYGKEIIIGGTPTGDDQMDYMELAAFKTEDNGVVAGQKISVTVKASIEGPIGYLYTNDGTGDWDNDITRYTYMICDVVIYNVNNPEYSYKLTRDFGSKPNHPDWNSDPYWEQVDLSSNPEFAGDGFDFSLFPREGGWLTNESMILNPDLVMRYQFKHGQPIAFKSLRYNIQQGTVTLPVAPASGRICISLSQIMNPGRIIYSKGVVDCFDTVLHSVVLNVGSEKAINAELTGESVYLSRNVKTAKIKKEKEIYANTASDGSIVGSLYTDIAYRDSVTWTLTEAGLVKFLNHDLFGAYLGDTSLLKYNAFAMQSFNAAQQLVYCRTKAANPTFKYYGVRFSSLVDDTHEDATNLYGYYHIIQRLVYDVKNCESEITAISMKANFREISTTTLDDNTDLLEEYNKQS